MAPEARKNVHALPKHALSAWRAIAARVKLVQRPSCFLAARCTRPRVAHNKQIRVDYDKLLLLACLVLPFCAIDNGKCFSGSGAFLSPIPKLGFIKVLQTSLGTTTEAMFAQAESSIGQACVQCSSACSN
eukprot:66669-Pelagomonas_calceolata.AAC.2